MIIKTKLGLQACKNFSVTIDDTEYQFSKTEKNELQILKLSDPNYEPIIIIPDAANKVRIK